MKKLITLTLSLLFIVNNLIAEEIPRDTLRVIDVEEIVVIATPKEHRKLRELPAAVTLLSQKDMQANQVNSMKNLTALVPNMFIPDYGSKITSAIYIRGIGSRINTPSVGLYVDNVPYVDKSAFDFSYADVERIDVLRGPQGTLYGRNAMGGLIRVHTKSPFSYQGTDLRLSAATYGNLNASLTHYHRVSDRFAFSAGGFYERADGFFKNSFNNKYMDDVEAGGGRMRGIWLPTDNLKFDLNVSYEYSDQGGYPYFYTGAVGMDEDRKDYIGKVSVNDPNNYRRGLLNTAFSLEHQADNFTLSAVTGYQNLNDRMAIDQDFTEKDIFNLVQKQRINTLSEEIVLKSKSQRNWEWTTGVFGFYQWLKTNAPVTFKSQGVKEMIEDKANEAFAGLAPSAPQMKLSINNSSLYIRDDFQTPVFNVAVYHQSTFHNLLVEGLSFTAGLRLDYEKTSIDYDAASDVLNFDFDLSMQRPPMQLTDNMDALAALKGDLKDDYLQLLPKFSLQYEWKKGSNVYATIARSHRSGGYNLQMISELISEDLRNGMKTALLESKVFGSASAMIEQFMPTYDINVEKEITYKPEYSWNFEVGSRLNLFDGGLWVDLAAFLLDTKDQQIARFADSGLGRIIVNAGHSRSYGAEAALRAQLTEGLGVNVNYGYTHAEFKDYITNIKTGDNEKPVEDVDYSGNYVPFVPQHTLSLNGQYTWRFGENKALRELTCNLGYAGAGKIYWTEANNVSQSFYGTVNARISALFGNIQVDVWGQNIFDKEYATFYFESMKRGFKQKGRPAQVGVDLRWRF